MSLQAISLLLVLHLGPLTPTPARSESTARAQAAAVLERALDGAPEEARTDVSVLGHLEAGMDRARALLGPDSEVARRLGRLARGAHFEGYLAGDSGAAWLAARLASVVADLRFEPVLEADLPVGFPVPTPVGEIQLQSYPAYRLARTRMRGAAEQGAFWRLFAHIQQNQIAMTAPVETTFAAGDAILAESSMAFLYGSTDLGETGAAGSSVEVVDVPAQVALSIGLRGDEARARVEGAREELARWLAAHPEWAVAGPLRTLAYNSPQVRGERRYFEVQLPVQRAGVIVIDFTDPAEAGRWRSVDDVVMGGRSSSRLGFEGEDSTVFEGELSLENNGGFASARTAGERCSLTGATSVTLRVRGDGQAYRLSCSTSDRRGSPGYQATFETRAGEWMDVTLPLAEFEPRWRGRLIFDAPALDPAAVRGLGLSIGDGQEGTFRLELRWLRKN